MINLHTRSTPKYGHLVRGAAVALLLLMTLPTLAANKTYSVKQLAEGVYGIVWDDPMSNPIEANNLVIINDRDVVVVDSSLLPSTAKRIITEVRKLTDKPVRYVINTHWHDDHVFGNAEWRKAFPDVEFVSHPNTRVDARDRAFGVLPGNLEKLEQNLARLEGMLESGKGPDGTDLTPDLRKQVEGGIEMLNDYLSDLRDLPTVVADLTVDDHLVIERGRHTIEVFYLGLGNTKGDLIVFLPNERIVATGDLVVHPTPFGIGSYYSEWIETLDQLIDLDAQVFFPGHGAPQRNTEYVETLQALLRDLIARVATSVGKGDTLDQTLETVTLEDWRSRLAGDDPTLIRAFDNYFVRPAVERAWRQAMGEPDTTDRLE